MGCFDYFMTQTRNEEYMAQFSPEQLEFLYSWPSWMVSFWAIAVWGALIGSFALLFRKRSAQPIFAVSILAMVISTIYSYGFRNGFEVMGDAFALSFTAIIFLVGVALLYYARMMSQRNVLH